MYFFFPHTSNFCMYRKENLGSAGVIRAMREWVRTKTEVWETAGVYIMLEQPFDAIIWQRLQTSWEKEHSLSVCRKNISHLSPIGFCHWLCISIYLVWN